MTNEEEMIMCFLYQHDKGQLVDVQVKACVIISGREALPPFVTCGLCSLGMRA